MNDVQGTNSAVQKGNGLHNFQGTNSNVQNSQFDSLQGAKSSTKVLLCATFPHFVVIVTFVSSVCEHNFVTKEKDYVHLNKTAHKY